MLPWIGQAAKVKGCEQKNWKIYNCCVIPTLLLLISSVARVHKRTTVWYVTIYVALMFRFIPLYEKG